MRMANLGQKLPSLGSIVDRQPLIVAPELPLVDVIFLMSQGKGHTCLMPGLGSSPGNKALDTSAAARHSSVLVVVNNRLIGIFTERDLVRLTANQTNLQVATVGDVMTADPTTLALSENHTIMTALAIFQQHQIRHLPIIDDRQQLIGVITPEHIRQVLQPINLLKFKSVAEGMTTNVIQALPTTTVLAIAQIMSDRNVSSIVIVDGQEPLKPIGIITERDIVQFQAFELNLDELLAASIMSSPLFCLQATDSLWAAQQIMHHKNIRRLVITNDRGELSGILTQSNLLQLLDPSEMLYMLENLQSKLIDRATELEKINRELQAEVARREQLEAELRQASQALTERVIIKTAESALLIEELHHKIAEQQSCDIALEASQQGISDFIENSLIGMHWVDILGNLVWVNQAELDMFGYDQAEYLGQPLMSFHVDRAKIADILQRVSHNESIKNCDAQVYRKDGSICDVSIDAHAFFKAGKFIHTRCFTRDITERKQLERGRERFLALGSDLQIIANRHEYFQWVSPTFESLLGWTTAEMTSRSWVEFLHPDDINPSIAEEISVLDGKKTMGFKNRCRHKDGSYRWLSWKAQSYPEEQLIYAVAVDVTEKKQLEQQFLRAQRLESLGSLASGIAHDLNNVLTPIVGAAQLLPLTMPNLDARSQRLLNMLVDSSHRGSGLVKQILTFARGLDGERRSIQVRHILTEIISVARQTFPTSIAISLNLDSEDLWLVNVDATQIHQVLMNLFINSRDAMPHGGEISASAENITIDVVYAKLQLPAGPYILIAIADNGIGMTSEVLKQIFDPFFTTKETGTGLGLATVQGIVKAHGGSIDVESEIGQGTCFKIYLPAIDSYEAEIPMAQEAMYEGRGQLVLVVDDEMAIREITKESLETYNYRVMLASDGIKAIDIYTQNHQNIAIVLVDMMMPHLDTSSIIRTLKQINPQVKIVVMSGSYIDLEEMINGQEVSAFLIKPFTTTSMLQTFATLCHTEH
jgi:two-component system, cell cycle sensor histidine kinase and response regulator CckA